MSVTSLIVRSARPEELPTLKQFEQGIIHAERPYDHTLKPDPISYYDIGELIASPDAEVIDGLTEKLDADKATGSAP